MESDGGHREQKDKQQLLRNVFLDLADAFVRLRMEFLRRRGVQPPDERVEEDRRPEE